MRVAGTPAGELLKGTVEADALWGRSGGDVVDGAEGPDLVFGGSAGDVLFGGVGDDIIVGGKGCDILNGGEGADVLIGGRGHDVFQLSLASGSDIGIDQVTDFRPTKDVVHLLVAWADTDAFVRYNKTDGALYLDPDGPGGAAELQVAFMRPQLDVGPSDIVIA
jgi:Ca2+-binding RTX toxin-like protein